MEWYLKVLKNYVGFSGRARRKEYWMFILFNVIFATVLSILGSIIKPLMALYVIYCLAIILPSLAVLVRRLHDTNKSGVWFLIAFVPLAGMIVLLVFMCQDSIPGDNQYGVNPKAEA